MTSCVFFSESRDQLEEEEDSGLLGLCGAKIPELDGLGANNEIEITQIKVNVYFEDVNDYKICGKPSTR